MTVTLADVAARARVSPATVSRVLNGNYPVAESTRERVLRAVDELDYVLNGPASSLAAATSDLVGVLVHDIADPFFGVMASAAQSAIGESGSGRGGGEKLAVVCNTGGSPERELTYLTLLQRQRAAAVILMGGSIEDPEHLAATTGKLAKLAEAGTRVVLCGRPPVTGDANAAALVFDNRGGARRLTEHLLELGHRRIGYAVSPADRTTTRHRLEGHRAALTAAGAAEGPTVHGAYTRQAGLRGHGRTPRPRPGPHGRRRRQRHRRARRLRGPAGTRPVDPGRRVRGGLRRPPVLGGRGPVPDDGPPAAARGGDTGGPPGDGHGGPPDGRPGPRPGGAGGTGIHGAAEEVAARSLRDAGA